MGTIPNFYDGSKDDIDLVAITFVHRGEERNWLTTREPARDLYRAVLAGKQGRGPATVVLTIAPPAGIDAEPITRDIDTAHVSMFHIFPTQREAINHDDAGHHDGSEN